ncbi:MAG: hypothetical protein AB7O73_14205, partial [Bacteroidia bacterium]
MPFKSKIPSFVFGLSIGLLIGVAFFLFKIDSIFSNLKSNLIQNKVTVVEQKVDEKEKNKSKNNKDRFKIPNTKGKGIEKNSNKDIDSLESESIIEQLTVASDVLIGTKDIKLIELSEEDDSDSLVEKLAGVKPVVSSSNYIIEFWKTPLNSKGYKFQRNKLLLYGVMDPASLSLYKLDGKYYLKNQEFGYEIKNSSDIQQLVKVQN